MTVGKFLVHIMLEGITNIKTLQFKKKTKKTEIPNGAAKHTNPENPSYIINKRSCIKFQNKPKNGMSSIGK